MIVYGYVKQYAYMNDGALSVQVRVPQIHGPYSQTDAGGKTIRNYVQDKDLPWYPSLLLPHLPNEGEVVMLQSANDGKGSEYVVLGLTGGSYYHHTGD